MSTSPNSDAAAQAAIHAEFHLVLNHLRRLRELWHRTPSLNVQRRTEAAISKWGRRARELKAMQ